MKVNTNGVGVQPEQQKETRTNLFAGSISCDQGEDGRVNYQDNSILHQLEDNL